MPAERLSSLDASFLYLETPALHMHVAGLSIFAPREDGPLTYDDVQRVVEARIHLAPRLRQRVLPVPGNIGRPVWVDDDRFDLDFHLRRSAVPSPSGRPRPLATAGSIEAPLGALRLRRGRCGTDGGPPEAPPRARGRDRQHVDRIGSIRSGG